VTWLLRLIAGVVMLAGQANLVPRQIADEEYGPDSRGQVMVEPRSGPPGTTITVTVRCTIGSNLTGAGADHVSLAFGKAYDTTYDKVFSGRLGGDGSGVFTVVVPEAPPSRIVSGGETDIAYGVSGSCFYDDMGLASFRRLFVVTAASVSSTAVSAVQTSLQSAAPVTVLPRTGARLTIPLTAVTVLLIGVGLAVWRARRRPSSSQSTTPRRRS
jgi:hypothetical protein